MKKDETILNELREISPKMAEIPSSMDHFSVPDGYFEGLPGSVLHAIRGLNVDEPSVVLNGIGKNTPYQIPAGYFDDLATGIMSRLKENAPFGEVMNELEELSPLLHAIERKSTYTIPEGYFSGLANQVKEGIGSRRDDDETESIPAWLADLRSKRAYTVPAGYWGNFADAVLRKVKETRRPAKLVSMFSKPWAKYAVAAAFTGILLTVGFFSFHKNNSLVNTDPVAALSKVSNQEIMNYLENQDIPVDETVVASSGNQDLNDSDVKDLFNDISDADLIQYASSSGGLKDL